MTQPNEEKESFKFFGGRALNAWESATKPHFMAKSSAIKVRPKFYDS